MNRRHLQRQLPQGADGLVLSSFHVLQGNRQQTNREQEHHAFNKDDQDGECDVSDQDGSASEGPLPSDEDYQDVQMYHRVTEAQKQQRRDGAAATVGPSAVIACPGGTDAIDLSLNRHGDEDDAFDDVDEDDCEDSRDQSPCLQTLQNMSGMHRADLNKSASGSELPGLGQTPQDDGLVQLTRGMAQTTYMTSSRNIWHPGHVAPSNACTDLPQNWHIQPNRASTDGLVSNNQDLDLLSGSPTLGDDWQTNQKGMSGVMAGRQQRDTDPWKFVHRGQSATHPLMSWNVTTSSSGNHIGDQSSPGSDALASQSVTSSGDPSWVEPVTPGGMEKHGQSIDLLQHGELDGDADWDKQLRHNLQNVSTWHKNMGGGFNDTEMRGHEAMYPMAQPRSSLEAEANQVEGVNYSSLAQATPGNWSYGAAAINRAGMTGIPRDLPLNQHSTPTPYFNETGPSRSLAGYPGQQQPVHYPSEYKTEVVPGIRQQMPSVSSRGQYKQSRLHIVKTAPNARPRLDHGFGQAPKPRLAFEQNRKKAHPYQLKEQKAVVRDVYPATSANVQTLKASHIVSWYIDYLIHENEDRTQISRAFSLPVNLFHSEDFYFMESLKKKVHFPSIKFLSWMQRNLPSINVNAVDFYEGRQPINSSWNQDWFWDTKSHRDIIHDVFYYFQRQRVASCNN